MLSANLAVGLIDIIFTGTRLWQFLWIATAALFCRFCFSDGRGQKTMSDSETMLYKEQLARQSEETIQSGGDLSVCPDEVFEFFTVSAPTGMQIYESFTDEELLLILTVAFERVGRCPSQKEVHCIYRQYIRRRFGNWPWALQAAGLKQPTVRTGRKRRWRYMSKKKRQ